MKETTLRETVARAIVAGRINFTRSLSGKPEAPLSVDEAVELVKALDQNYSTRWPMVLRDAEVAISTIEAAMEADACKSEDAHDKAVAAAWSMLFAMQKDSYELLLPALSPHQTRVLRALAHACGETTLSANFIETTGITLAPSVRKAMVALVERRLIQKSDTTYRFCDPFLAV